MMGAWLCDVKTFSDVLLSAAVLCIIALARTLLDEQTGAAWTDSMPQSEFGVLPGLPRTRAWNQR
jgi:hypothetical protein